jgi:hypothetical protein
MRQHSVEEPGQSLRRQLHTESILSRELFCGGPLGTRVCRPSAFPPDLSWIEPETPGLGAKDG